MDSCDGFQSNHFFLNLCDIICRFPGSSNFWLHPPSYIQGQGQLRRVWNEAVRSNGIQVCYAQLMKLGWNQRRQLRNIYFDRSFLTTFPIHCISGIWAWCSFPWPPGTAFTQWSTMSTKAGTHLSCQAPMDSYSGLVSSCFKISTLVNTILCRARNNIRVFPQVSSWWPLSCSSTTSWSLLLICPGVCWRTRLLTPSSTTSSPLSSRCRPCTASDASGTTSSSSSSSISVTSTG